MTTLLIVVALFVLLAALHDLIGWLVVGEVRATLQERLADRVRAATALLPLEQREDLESEWLAELDALKDQPRRAVLFVRGLRTAAQAITHQSEPTSAPGLARDSEPGVAPAPISRGALPNVVLEHIAALAEGARFEVAEYSDGYVVFEVPPGATESEIRCLARQERAIMFYSRRSLAPAPGDDRGRQQP